MKNLIFVFFLLNALQVFGQFRGRVFEDTNENGLLDSAERQLSDIRVSDGLNVSLTDRFGKYNLAGYAKTRFLFVTSPAGYRPVKSHYLKVQQSDTVYNFAMRKDAKLAGSAIRMIHISDTETDLIGDWISNVRNFASQQQAAFTVHTGDICYESGLNFHAKQVNTQRMKMPVHYALGNHDLVKGPYGESLFESLFGPPYYSFDAGPAHFIITPMANGDFRPDYDIDQLIAWIRNDLKFTSKDKPVFIFNHDLPFASGQFLLKGKKDSIDLSKNGLKAWIYGHWHSNFVKRYNDNGIYAICTSPPNKGGIDNSPGRFLSIDIDANGIKKVEQHYANIKEHLVIIQPLPVSSNLLHHTKLSISVNAYDSEKKIYRVDATVYDQNDRKVNKIALRNVNSWNWRAEMNLPNVNSSQNFHIIVESIYSDGSSTIRRKGFKIKSPYTNMKSFDLLWSKNLGGNIWNAAPVVSQGKIFVATIDDAENKFCGVSAMDANTGKIIWQYKTKNSVKHSVSFENNVALVTDAMCIAYALEANSGKLIWKNDPQMSHLPGYQSGSIVRDGLYYTGYGNYLRAIDVKTGKIIWTNSSWRSWEGSPAGMVIAKEVLITSSNWNALFGHDLKTGKLLWKRNDEGLRFRSGTPTYKNNMLYVTGLNNLFVLNPLTGETISKSKTPFDFKVMGAPLLDENGIYLSTSARGISAFDKSTLKYLWNFPTGEALVYTAPYFSPDSLIPIQTVEASPAKKGEDIIFGASDGFLYLLNAKTGTQVERVNLGSPIFSQVSISNDRYYVSCYDGNIYCFKR